MLVHPISAVFKGLNSTYSSKKGVSVYWINDPCWCNMIQESKYCHDEGIIT